MRACFNIFSDALSGRPHQSLQPSFTALSSQVIFMFSACHVKKNFPFYEPQFGRIWLSILLSDSVLETKKLQAKVLNLTCRTIYVCKLLQNVKFDRFAFLTALVLYSQSDYLNYFNRDSNCGVLYESIEYTDDTFVRFGNNVCFKNWK